MMPDPDRRCAAGEVPIDGERVLPGYHSVTQETTLAAIRAAAAAQRCSPGYVQLVNAGEILIGQHTLFSAGNFVIGCPASLPTGGFAHVSSGITADTFLKRTAVARADATALRRMTPTILAMSAHEGFPAHANAAEQRAGK